MTQNSAEVPPHMTFDAVQHCPGCARVSQKYAITVQAYAEDKLAFILSGPQPLYSNPARKILTEEEARNLRDFLVEHLS